MRPARRRLVALGLASGLGLLAGCTTFGEIAWRNARVVFREPDAVPDRIVRPARADARLAALWVGHSTVLLQMDDRFVLTDPVFTRYVGGVSPRLVEPGIAAADLPRLDAVLVSHRHFDHLSTGSLASIADRVGALLVPPGAAADIPREVGNVRELATWEGWEQDGLRVTAVPAHHSGGRFGADAGSHPRAFAGFVVQYHGMTVYFAGDTADDPPMFREIARRFGAIDLALMPIGPIEPVADMRPEHLDPAEALAESAVLRAREMLPIHFATFIDSCDDAGSVEAAFDRALADMPPAGVHARRWRIGEQRVLIAR